MGSSVPKPLLMIGGRTILEHSLRAMLDSAVFSRIVILVPEIQRQDFTAVVAGLAEQSRPRLEIVIGGSTRQISVWNGLKFLKEQEGSASQAMYVMVHDAARCLVSAKLFQDSLACVVREQACTAALPVVDTLRRADSSAQFIETVERSGVWSIQTPQSFRFDLLWQAHKQAQEQGMEASDDAALVEPLCKVKIVQGELSNVKITTSADLEFAERFFVPKRTLAGL